MKTPEEVQELQKELQAWMEKNDLTHDTGWRKPKEHVGEPQTLADGPVYLILWFEGDFYYVMWPSGSPDRDWHEQRREEFDAIVDDHGFWYDFENSVTMYFMELE